MEAGSVGALGSTAARVSHKEQGTQAYEAQRLPVKMRLGTAPTYGGGGASRAAAARAPEGVKKKPKKPTLPCFFAAAQARRGVALLGKDGRPVRRCPMFEQGQCQRSHDTATCRALWTDDAEFREKLDVYVEIVERNRGRIPSKAQL